MFGPYSHGGPQKVASSDSSQADLTLVSWHEKCGDSTFGESLSYDLFFRGICEFFHGVFFCLIVHLLVMESNDAEPRSPNRKPIPADGKLRITIFRCPRLLMSFRVCSLVSRKYLICTCVPAGD